MSDRKLSSWTRRTLVEQPAVLVSGLYLVASVIGLVYSWAFLHGFGINVFRYAEISDFLLASLKEPFTWALAIFAVAMFLVDNAMSRRLEARGLNRFFRWYGSERYRQTNYLALAMMIIIFLFVYATSKELSIRDGEGDIVTVHLTDASPPKQLTMLGTTGKFVFLFDHVAERVDIHPHESILMITKSAPGPIED